MRRSLGGVVLVALALQPAGALPGVGDSQGPPQGARAQAVVANRAPLQAGTFTCCRSAR